MSAVRNGVRCDWCGKIANNLLGEYLDPRGRVSARYIHSPDWDKESGMDICEECAENRCSFCGSDKIVRQTPTVAGPIGWGYRCKECNRVVSFAFIEPIPSDCLPPPDVLLRVLRGPAIDPETGKIAEGVFEGMTPAEVRADAVAFRRACE